MTDLDIWNNLILDHFFNINRSGKLVRLNVTKELIEQLGAGQGWKFDDYLNALKNGSCYILQTKEKPNICEYAFSLYEFSNDQIRWPLVFINNKKPPYVAYLAFLVYLTTLQNTNNNSYHKRLWEAFPLNNTKVPPTFYPDFDKIDDLLKGLENWSKGVNLGEFSISRLGNLGHISFLKSQAILTEKEKTDLPHFFASANLNKNSIMDANRWKQAIRDNPKSFMNRTLEALDHDRLSDYLISDLADALKHWDGTIPNQLNQNAIQQNSIQKSNVSKLVIFINNKLSVFSSRLKFDSEFSDYLDRVIYSNSNQTLYTTPINGWNYLQNFDGTRFDASTISWTTPFKLKTINSNAPTELSLEAKEIRVFVSASRLVSGQGGYFEVEKLPSSGECLIAYHNNKSNEINNWLIESGLSPILKNNARLAEGWKLLYLKEIPTDQNIRNNFPGESENPDVIFKFVGGLKYKKQGRVSNNKYYSNFPPCVELHGEYRDWVLTCNNKTLQVNSEGIAKLPENLGTGKFIIKIIKNNELQEKPIELFNVYHAGDPLRIHKHMDKFGFSGENTTGFSGAWLSDLTASNYEWSSKTQNNRIIFKNRIQYGINAEFLTSELIQGASDCKNYPVQYFYDLCKLNSDAPIKDRNLSGERVTKFHEQNGLFPPEQGLPLSRLNIYESSIHSTPSNCGHTHSFSLPDVKVFKEKVTFLMQSNADPEGCSLKLKSHPTKDQFPKCNGIYSSPAPFNRKHNQGTLRGDRPEKYDTSYQLYITNESFWSVNKVQWAPNKWDSIPRWIYPECCSIKQLIITPWQPNDLFKHLDVNNSLLKYGKNISHPNEISIPNDLETLLTEENELEDIHKRVIKSPPSIQKVLSIKGSAQSEILEFPEYENMPTSVKLAWILAWIDRRVAWEGRSILNKIKVEHQLALRKAILIAFKIDHPWANLFTKCLAISEYVYTILRKKGLGKKISFGETSDSSDE